MNCDPAQPRAARRAQDVDLQIADEIAEPQVAQFERLCEMATNYSRRITLHDSPSPAVGEERIGLAIAFELTERRA